MPAALSHKLFSPIARYRAGMVGMYCLLTVAILLPYYQSKGLRIADFFFVEAVFRTAYLLANLVSGTLSDRWHRRGCMLVGAALWWLGSATILFAHSVVFVMAGEMLLATGMAFYTSAGRAWLYDYLLEAGQPQAHARELSIQRAAESGMRMLAYIVGGSLYLLHPDLPQASVLFTTALAFGFFYSLPEVTPHAMRQQALSIGFHQALLHLLRLPGLLRLLLLNALLSGTATVLFWAVQPRLQELQAGTVFTGLLMAFAAGFTALISAISHRIIHRTGMRRLALLLVPLASALLLAMDHASMWQIVLVAAGHATLYALANNAFEDLLHHQVPSSLRGAAVSLNLIGQGAMAVPMLVFTGWLQQKAGLAASLSLLAALTGLAGLVLLARFMAVLGGFRQPERAGQAGLAR